ncbi:MAG: PIN domain-containing protein [Armatimonadetes bacterium]|nr:PIN domain-containing protein [Armatimonadota bacterium]
MNKALLDTDILSEVLKGRNPQVVAQAEAYLRHHAMLTVSAVSVIEVVSGLQRMARSAQLEQFLGALDAIEVLPVDTQSAVLAGRIDGDLLRTGQPIGRADPIIAAQAITHGLVLVTGNVRHYERIVALGYPLRMANWRDSDG